MTPGEAERRARECEVSAARCEDAAAVWAARGDKVRAAYWGARVGDYLESAAWYRARAGEVQL